MKKGGIGRTGKANDEQGKEGKKQRGKEREGKGIVEIRKKGRRLGNKRKW